MSSALTVSKIYESRRGGQVAHFSVTRGKPGGLVTVRVGIDGVYCCLTCRSTTCAHARAVESFEGLPSGYNVTA